jgi:hypothetical protein
VTTSFVLHLKSGALAEGEVRGVVEIVSTGEQRVITTLDQLGAVLIQQSHDKPDRADREI